MHSSNKETTRPAFGASTLRWVLPFLAVFCPIVLLSVTAERVATRSLKSVLEAEHIAAVGNLSSFLGGEAREAAIFAKALGSLPGTISAVQAGDTFSLTSRLKAAVIASDQAERALILDTAGSTVASYPVSSGSLVATPEMHAWLKRIASHRSLSLSPVYVRTDDSHAFAYGAPVVSTGGTLLGILALEVPASRLNEWMKDLDVPQGMSLVAIDHDGTLVAHPSVEPLGPLIRDFSLVKAVSNARTGQTQTTEYTDPVLKTEMIATFQPIAVGPELWITVAQQPVTSAYAEIIRARGTLVFAGTLLTILTLGLVIALARMSARVLHLNRTLEIRNQELRETASIVGSSFDAIIGMTPEGHIRTWNRAAEMMYGYTETETIGKSILEIVTDAAKPPMTDLLWKLRKGETVRDSESERKTKSGGVLPVSVTLSPIDDGKGNVVGISSIERDTTERKKLEQLKSDFLSFVSHQLKAPITALKWSIEMVENGDYGEIPEKMKSFFVDLKQVSDHCWHLISNILNMSRIDRGVVSVSLSPMTLSQVVDLSVRDYRVAAEKAGLYLRIEGSNGGTKVLTDAEKMAEAISNSISNALKHTKSGGITVSMRSDEEYGYIDVADTGEGMSADMVQKLFSRDQVLGGGASAEKSAGLGLYIARNFVKIQGGDVTVISVPGKGSTFTYSIPLAKGDGTIQEDRKVL